VLTVALYSPWYPFPPCGQVDRPALPPTAVLDRERSGNDPLLVVKTPWATIYLDPFTRRSIYDEGAWTRLFAPHFDPMKVARCDRMPKLAVLRVQPGARWEQDASPRSWQLKW